jgi:hypothetical protein
MSRLHRFTVGQKVWVRDFRLHGYAIVEATVIELHYHPGRHPWYPDGEGYDLEGDLWWTCYPGCRVFATKEEATAARMKRSKEEFEGLAAQQREVLNGDS